MNDGTVQKLVPKYIQNFSIYMFLSMIKFLVIRVPSTSTVGKCYRHIQIDIKQLIIDFHLTSDVE